MRYLLSVIGLLAACSPAASADSDTYTTRWQVYAHQLLEDSIPFETVRGEGQVLPFARYLEAEFLEHGFPADDVHVIEMDSDGVPSASLVVRYAGKGNSGGPILFVGHLDVVPAGAEDWGRDPFILSEEDGFFYGRGVLDDKFATTVLTTTFLRLRSEGFEPERDLVLVYTGDEETKQSDIRTLLRDHKELVTADLAIVVDGGPGLLDPSGSPVVTFVQNAEKNYLTFRISARAPGGHSSKPNPDNSIYKLAAAITALQNLTFPARGDQANRDFFRTMGTLIGGELGDAMQRFADDPADMKAIRRIRGDMSLVGRLGTTCIPTMLAGGQAENALPELVSVTVNCRVYPGVPTDEVEERIRTAIGDPDIEIERTWDPLPAIPSPASAEITEFVRTVTHRRTPEIPIVYNVGSGTTDGKFIRIAGIDAYGLLGLHMHPEDILMHASDERLPVDGFFESLEFWYDLMRSTDTL